MPLNFDQSESRQFVQSESRQRNRSEVLTRQRFIAWKPYSGFENLHSVNWPTLTFSPSLSFPIDGTPVYNPGVRWLEKEMVMHYEFSASETLDEKTTQTCSRKSSTLSTTFETEQGEGFNLGKLTAAIDNLENFESEIIEWRDDYLHRTFTFRNSNTPSDVVTGFQKVTLRRVYDFLALMTDLKELLDSVPSTLEGGLWRQNVDDGDLAYFMFVTFEPHTEAILRGTLIPTVPLNYADTMYPVNYWEQPVEDLEAGYPLFNILQGTGVYYPADAGAYLKHAGPFSRVYLSGGVPYNVLAWGVAIAVKARIPLHQVQYAKRTFKVKFPYDGDFEQLTPPTSYGKCETVTGGPETLYVSPPGNPVYDGTAFEVFRNQSCD
jgi:hypothetical protein